MTKGNLFLIPAVIAETTTDVIPVATQAAIKSIHYFLAEEVRTTRRYLSSLKVHDSIESLTFSVLNKHTQEHELAELMKPVFAGKNVGVLSESGCPGVADPGAMAVDFAHRHGIKVIPLTGPSSILLGLMASGLNGQRFAFQGYLPIESKEAAAAIREFEKGSRSKGQTQIFIETPYRNNQILQHLLKNLHSETRLCLAVDITGNQEFINTRTVREWRSSGVELPKLPAVFLFLAR